MAMRRVAAVLLAVSALSAAICFVGPSVPGAAPSLGEQAAQVERARLAGAAPEGATTQAGGAWSPVALGVALGLLAAVVGGRPALA
eukprot:CAMPEP_0197872772 /NCGR_PEP_ID=MMETSP1439-20131203/2781_1 /TAXON_ID=66791 /ORGANISM="Gonyaulax spinifera, Strain CCMP409" /LENGTH=85 /DNA_ID=CAMNT_0043491793 /DNA_START=95 /DNA_END=348 /DNA_ORIENTATION=+